MQLIFLAHPVISYAHYAYSLLAGYHKQGQLHKNCTVTSCIHAY